MRDLPKFESDKLLVGLDTSDDAAVYKINEEQAIINTLDFFTPIVDDPYTFGQIAAANALSDIYAMGGKPIVALNIVTFPDCLDPEVLTEILKGGADKVKEAGALLVGGHTVKDNEPKYGLSVTGIIHPDKVLDNASAKVGDVLVLTKPIGTGILNTALKADMLDDEMIKKVSDIMAELNKYAAEPLKDLTVHSCTDITGFGLAGHAFEMAKGSDVTIEMYFDQIKVLDKAKEYAQMGMVPGGTYSNVSYMSEAMHIEGEEYIRDIVFDPQTSGGLLISLPPAEAEKLLAYYKNHLNTEFSIIGRVKEKEEYSVIVKEKKDEF